jgi:hypothetical protein
LPEKSAEIPLDIAAVEGDVSALIARVQASRPLIANYLAGAKSSSKSGNRITLVFEPAQSFFAESLSDQVKSLEELAAEVYGEPTKIEIRAEGASAPAAKKESPKSAVREDPVIQAFQKHLGVEIVEPRKR